MENEILIVEQYLLEKIQEKKITLADLSRITKKIIGSFSQGSADLEVGCYAFEGGRFSSNKSAYSDLLGVVAWLNPDPNAPSGSRGLILLPDEVCDVWQTKKIQTNVCNKQDGEKNTQALLELYGEAISFPALKWLKEYNKRAVEKAFVPAVEQVVCIVKNTEKVNPALKKIGGAVLSGWIFSSTEYNTHRQASVLVPVGCEGFCGKKQEHAVRFVVPF